MMHIAGAPEAEALIARGFVEGSPNVHQGQGTASRRFFFANFMLELLWVTDPAEAAKVRHTGLWERWAAGASRFGIVYGGSADSLSHAARRVREAGLLDFFETPSPVLEVYFRSDDESSIDCRPHLPQERPMDGN